MGPWKLVIFILENYILSENHGLLIELLDSKESYHYIYRCCPTAAVVSIAYTHQKTGSTAVMVEEKDSSLFVFNGRVGISASRWDSP